MGLDLADVVVAAAEYGEKGIANGAFERVAGQTAVGFHMADLGLDGAATEISVQLWRQATMCAADQPAGSGLAMAAISTVDDRQIGALIGQDLRLFQCRGEDVTVAKDCRES